MALTVVWEKCSVDKPVKTDKDGRVTEAEAVVLKRGEALPDYVSDFVRATLTQIGAVRDLAAATEMVAAANEADFATPPPPPVLSAEVPPANVTTGGGAVEVVHNAETGDTSTTTSGDTQADVVMVTKPSVTDNKDAWERYAADRGYFTQAEAEAMTKTKLMAEVNKRESA
jgi:hypothetical protein